MKNRTLIVLGMHRSGTSCLTGSLEEAGVSLGETDHKNQFNEKGNREFRSIQILHDDILKRNDASWDRPKLNPKWDTVHAVLRDTIIESFQTKSIWAFKDPRTVFTLRGWLRVLPNAELIGIYRHPYFVAESLAIRNGMSHEKAIELWLNYNYVLLWYYENLKTFPVLEFSIDEDDFLRQLNSLLDSLGLSAETSTFFNRSMRQSKLPNIEKTATTDRALKLYENLQNIRMVQS